MSGKTKLTMRNEVSKINQDAKKRVSTTTSDTPPTIFSKQGKKVCQPQKPSVYIFHILKISQRQRIMRIVSIFPNPFCVSCFWVMACSRCNTPSVSLIDFRECSPESVRTYYTVQYRTCDIRPRHDGDKRKMLQSFIHIIFQYIWPTFCELCVGGTYKFALLLLTLLLLLLFLPMLVFLLLLFLHNFYFMSVKFISVSLGWHTRIHTFLLYTVISAFTCIVYVASVRISSCQLHEQTWVDSF